MDRIQLQILIMPIQFQIIQKVEVEDLSEKLVTVQVDLIMTVPALTMALKKVLEEPIKEVGSIQLKGVKRTVANKCSWTLTVRVMVQSRTLLELQHTK